MLRLIPAPLHRLALRMAHAVRQRYWRIARPHLSGCCMIGLDAAGRVLLVRHHYGLRLWTLPGGALRRGEDPALAARREWREELGCDLADLSALAVFEHELHGAHSTVHLFAGQVGGQPKADGREIAEYAFFARDSLPEGCSRTVAERLALIAPGARNAQDMAQ